MNCLDAEGTEGSADGLRLGLILGSDGSGNLSFASIPRMPRFWPRLRGASRKKDE